jgi:hypothetical protein
VEPEPKPGGVGGVSTSEPGDQDQDFANVWDAISAFSARGWCDGTPDAVVRSLQNLGLPRGLAVLPADQPPFQGTIRLAFIHSCLIVT